MYDEIKREKVGYLPWCIGFFIAGCALIGVIIYFMMPVFTGQQTFSKLSKDKAAIGPIITCLISWPILWLLAGVFLNGALNCDKKLRKYCQENNAWDKVEQFYNNTRPICGNLRIGKEYILGFGDDILFLPIEDLVWAYSIEIDHKQAGVITVAREYRVMFCGKDGSKKSFPAASETRASLVIQYIQKFFPWIVTGYSDAVETTFKNNRQNMINTVEERRLAFEKMADSKNTSVQ